MSNWATLGVPPPEKPVTRPASRRFVRALLLRSLAFVIPVWLSIWLMGDMTAWLWILAVASVGGVLLDIVLLTSRLRSG